MIFQIIICVFEVLKTLWLDIVRYACIAKTDKLIDDKTKYVYPLINDLGLIEEPKIILY